MYLVESKGGAITCMFFSLFFLGTWPAILTLLERRGRLPQHTYLDYSITNLLAAVVIALTFGQIGSSTPASPNFLTQLSQLGDNWPSVLFAMAGGLVLSLGNLCIQYAWAFVGLSVTEVITSSLVVVIGNSSNQCVLEMDLTSWLDHKNLDLPPVRFSPFYNWWNLSCPFMHFVASTKNMNPELNKFLVVRLLLNL
ncbi:Ureide permease 2 [Linum perenne]